MLLPFDPFLMFNPVGLGEITTTKFRIQSGRSFLRQGLPRRCQVQKLVITPLGIFGREVDRHRSLILCEITFDSD
jgi:hypothetical protein